MPETSRTGRSMRRNLENTWNDDMDWSVVPQKLKDGCKQFGRALSLPPLSVLCGLMVLASFSMGHSAVHLSGTDWFEPVIVWLVVVMPSGCGKSTLYKFLKRIIHDVRTKLQLPNDSPAWSAEEVTMERMGAMMNENDCKLLGIFDEFTHFLTQINVYRGKAITDSQDLAMLLQLNNGLPWSRKTVSRECNFSMPLTSFTIGGFTQPMTASNIICQAGSAEKGLSTRFLWVSPKPVFQSMSELETTDKEFYDEYVSLLTTLMKARKGDGLDKKVYELNKEECPSFSSIYDEVQGNLRNITGYDEMLTGMLSKSKGQILRVAAVFTELFNIGENSAIINISDLSITAASAFVRVACNHACYLASRTSLTDEIASIIQDVDLEEPVAQSSVKERNIKAHTLLIPGRNLYVTPLIKKKKWRGYGDKDKVIATLQELEELGLGTLTSDKGPGSHVRYAFEKAAIPEDDNLKAEFTTKLTELEVSIRQYRLAIEEPDILSHQVTPAKRPIDETAETRKSPRKLAKESN